VNFAARLITALAGLALFGASARADIVDRLDQPAGEIVAQQWWNGTAPKMSALKGKVVVLHLSDPARVTSKGFVPNLVKLTTAYKDQGVVFIELVANETDGVAADYVKDATVTWTVGWDRDGAIQKDYPGSSLPRTYVIGPDGKVAWHAHVAALTKSILDAQLTRCTFFDPAAVPAAARPAAKAMLEFRFADAIAAADKVFTDAGAPGDAKAYCAKVKLEVSRYFAFQFKVLETLMAELDWAVAYRRVERMLVVYKGTDHEAEVRKKKAELDDNPRVKYIVEAQKHLDEMVRDVSKDGPRDLEKLVLKLKDFVEQYPDTAVGKKANEWIAECERRLKKFAGK
jgi:hypothetical protein